MAKDSDIKESVNLNYWLFQGNPNYYRVIDAIRESEKLYWTVSAYYKQIHPGDKVIIWVCGVNAGIYAVAEVIKEPKIIEIPEKNYWLDIKRASKKYFTQIQFTKKILEHPLLKVELIKEPFFERFPIFRYPNGVDYKLTLGEWEKISQLIEKLAT